MAGGHRDHMRVLRRAVNTPARYVAMIGSKRKTIEVVEFAAEMIAMRRIPDGAWRKTSKSIFTDERYRSLLQRGRI